MDCKAARVLLPYCLTPGRDLDGPERDELDAHLASCSECNSLVRNERRLDQHLGRAMNAVTAPPGLRDQILCRVAAERGDWHRRRAGFVFRIVAAAAAVIAVIWGWYSFYSPPRQTIDVNEMTAVLHPGITNKPENINAAFRRMGYKTLAPRFVNYGYLLGAPALAELPGYENVKVPQLIFARGDQRAIVYILPKKKFKLQLPDEAPAGYRYTIDVEQDNGFVYLVLHTGKNWNWLRVSGE